MVYESIEGQYDKDMTNISTLANSSKYKAVHFFRSGPKSTEMSSSIRMVSSFMHLYISSDVHWKIIISLYDISAQ